MQASFLIGLALAVGAPALKDPKKDPPSVVGEWAPVSAVIAGQATPVPKGSQITFSRDRKCTIKDGMAASIDLTYTADAKKQPAEIDVSDADARAGASVLKGIYKFDGDTLLICISLGGDRPKTFESLPRSQTLLLTFHRFTKD
jgi:uncharacterized protein (TIGR03067 family)